MCIAVSVSVSVYVCVCVCVCMWVEGYLSVLELSNSALHLGADAVVHALHLRMQQSFEYASIMG